MLKAQTLEYFGQIRSMYVRITLVISGVRVLYLACIQTIPSLSEHSYLKAEGITSLTDPSFGNETIKNLGLLTLSPR